MAFDGEGEALVKRVVEATRLGVDQTTAACVMHAKQNHPWHNVTATLEGSLEMRPATLEGAMVRGTWGSFSVLYAIFLELKGWAYLRPAADTEYPNLVDRIRANLGS